MTDFRASMIGFDITPRIHPTGGAWGTTPNLTEVDLPLLSRCLVLDQDGRRLVWFSSDLVGDPLHDTDVIRGELAAALDLSAEQVVWSTLRALARDGLGFLRRTASAA